MQHPKQGHGPGTLTGATGTSKRHAVASTYRPMEVSMASTDASSSTSAQMPRVGTCDMKLEVVTLPVSDVDRAKRFYQSLGWRLDADIVAGDAFRVVQLTPPHSSCSIAFGKGVTTGEPGSVKRLLLVVDDIA